MLQVLETTQVSSTLIPVIMTHYLVDYLAKRQNITDSAGGFLLLDQSLHSEVREFIPLGVGVEDARHGEVQGDSIGCRRLESQTHVFYQTAYLSL